MAKGKGNADILAGLALAKVDLDARKETLTSEIAAASGDVSKVRAASSKLTSVEGDAKNLKRLIERYSPNASNITMYA